MNVCGSLKYGEKEVNGMRNGLYADSDVAHRPKETPRAYKMLRCPLDAVVVQRRQEISKDNRRKQIR